MLRCWSIWRGILTKKIGIISLAGGRGPKVQGQRAPQTITFWISVSEWFYFTRFERSRFYKHFDTKIIQIGPQPVIWPLEDCGSTWGAQIWGWGALKWGLMGPQVWKLAHNVLPWIQTIAHKKEWNLRRCVKISMKNVYTWPGTPLVQPVWIEKRSHSAVLCHFVYHN